jgi:hypothetical protein
MHAYIHAYIHRHTHTHTHTHTTSSCSASLAARLSIQRPVLITAASPSRSYPGVSGQSRIKCVGRVNECYPHTTTLTHLCCCKGCCDVMRLPEETHPRTARGKHVVAVVAGYKRARVEGRVEKPSGCPVQQPLCMVRSGIKFSKETPHTHGHMDTWTHGQIQIHT